MVFSTLLPLRESPTLSKPIRDYLSRLQGLTAVQSGIEKVRKSGSSVSGAGVVHQSLFRMRSIAFLQ